MRSKKIISISLAIIGFYLTCSPANAMAPERKGKMEKPSGMSAIFYDDANCVNIASPYGSTTRYDGSDRPTFRFGGHHGGVDLSLPNGTPIHALAAGKVLHKGKGERMEGNFLWLQHSPEQTGLAYWVYSKYQHLQAIPEIPIDTRVVAGQEIGLSGDTGTKGRHYGSMGYSHLHLSTIKSSKGKNKIMGSKILTQDSSLFDPLLVYYETTSKSEALIEQSHQGKSVVIPYITNEGEIFPKGAMVVWPVACTPR